MKIKAILIAALTMAQLGLAPSISVAHDYTVGDLTIDHTNSRPTLPNRPMAAYMTISNDGSDNDELIGAFSPDFKAIELHRMVDHDGVMKMEQLDVIPVPADGMTMLKPGGMHMMLFGAERTFKQGDSFPVTLEFVKSGPVEVVVKVEKMAHGDGDHSGHGSGQSN